MSDDEGTTKKSGYRLDYAPSARAKCKGPKPCNGTPIGKDELRMGSVVDFKGNSSFAWRHWGCVTKTIIANMKKSFEEADELDGFEELNEEDQERVRKAWEVGHVADEDIPETARKPDGEEQNEDEDVKPAKKKAAGKAAAKKDDGPGVFKLEYAPSGRAVCKGGCSESIGKDYLRIGHEIDFRGNKSFTYQHFGCVPEDLFAKFKKSYPEPSQIQGFDSLQDADKEKVQRAWDNGSIPEDDKGPGEPAPGLSTKKAPAKKAKNDDKPPRKRARKAKKDEDEDGEEEIEEPKAKRAPAKKAAAKEKAPAKKRASKKKDSEEESGEDFAADIDAISGDEDEVEEEEESNKKRNRAPAAKASSSKPASKTAAKPASKTAAKKAAPVKATKPSSRKRKQESDDEEDYDE